MGSCCCGLRVKRLNAGSWGGMYPGSWGGMYPAGVDRAVEEAEWGVPRGIGREARHLKVTVGISVGAGARVRVRVGISVTVMGFGSCSV